VFDNCIEDLKEGEAQLLELATLMQCVGIAKDSNVFLAAYPIIGGFGAEIMRFRQLNLLPMLPEELRRRLDKILNEAITAGQEALKLLKNQIYGSSDLDYKEVIRALGILNKHDYMLTIERSALTRIRLTVSPKE